MWVGCISAHEWAIHGRCGGICLITAVGQSQPCCNRALMLHFRCIGYDEAMFPKTRSSLLVQAFTCWNWKCALLSATARSLVYLAAMARTGLHGGGAVVLVEIAYVTLTAGVYAGMQ